MLSDNMFSENTLSGNTYDFGKYESTRFENTQRRVAYGSIYNLPLLNDLRPIL